MTASLAAALALVLWGAAQASAGGPTSVLVVSPESQESASLYFSDERYERLARLVGEPGEGKKEIPPGLEVGSGRQLNVTWLRHDISPWRVDRVYPDTPGSKEVWIHTSTDMETLNGVWHTAQHPAELRSLLHKLGVMGKAKSGGAGAVFPAPDRSQDRSTTQPQATPSGTAPAAVGSTPGSSGWWWVVPGLLAGAALALLARPAAVGLPRKISAVWRHREPGPRQELRGTEAP
ncbi:hypothetical protein [Streptomyces sp. SID5785]|uniref:hypothetical protein n=1 Tax=Streptomyces sp. SID5785 TaxID=2690309 RepID=UPI001F1A54C5|nr:hypothetical protein [Streptomyces sp. SID5785]